MFKLKVKNMSPWINIIISGIIVFAAGIWNTYSWMQLQKKKKTEASQNIQIDGNVVSSNIIQIIGSNSEEMNEIFNDIIKSDNELQRRTINIEKKFYEQQLARISKFYPSGYKKESFMTGPTEISKKLKECFSFMKNNFDGKISVNQFKEINRRFEEILIDEPYLPYIWFYRGVLFSYASASDKTDIKLREKFKEHAINYFIQANKLFDDLIVKNPDNPYIILFKGMTLTFLQKGKESILYLREVLRVKPQIFKEHNLLGMITFYRHIDNNFLNEWETAFNMY